MVGVGIIRLKEQAGNGYFSTVRSSSIVNAAVEGGHGIASAHKIHSLADPERADVVLTGQDINGVIVISRINSLTDSAIICISDSGGSRPYACHIICTTGSAFIGQKFFVFVVIAIIISAANTSPHLNSIFKGAVVGGIKCGESIRLALLHGSRAKHVFKRGVFYSERARISAAVNANSKFPAIKLAVFNYEIISGKFVGRTRDLVIAPAKRLVVFIAKRLKSDILDSNAASLAISGHSIFNRAANYRFSPSGTFEIDSAPNRESISAVSSQFISAGSDFYCFTILRSPNCGGKIIIIIVTDCGYHLPPHPPTRGWAGESAPLSAPEEWAKCASSSFGS
ncbi:MAG: hypothetical protein ACLUFT_12550, partial [Gemmiger formicilis]|uniref:hypothetical protein n=1 Tax=Gemmiger formicilis TaxID=745368 RepID=UPI0039941745